MYEWQLKHKTISYRMRRLSNTFRHFNPKNIQDMERTTITHIQLFLFYQHNGSQWRSLLVYLYFLLMLYNSVPDGNWNYIIINHYTPKWMRSNQNFATRHPFQFAKGICHNSLNELLLYWGFLFDPYYVS